MKVLITDDEYHVIQAIRLLVPWAELGVEQIFTANSGREALTIIQSEAPEIVITDIVMADLGGIDIMNFIASHCPATKVIAVSGHSDFEYVRAMLTKGCMDYLLKPLESAALIATVSKVVESWKTDHEVSRRNYHLQEKVYSLSAFYMATLLYNMANARDWADSYQKLLQLDTRFSLIAECKICYYHTGFFPMQKSDFAGLQKAFEEQLRQLLRSGQPPALPSAESEGGGILLSNPECSGEVILFLYKSVESLTASILKLAQSLFCGRPYPFHIGISEKKTFPEQFSEAFCQARSAFLSTDSSQDFSSMEIAASLRENQSASDIMLQIARYMELNYSRPFVQSEYAKRFFFNKDYMSRKFTSTFGVNMLTYLNQIRIRHARELLGDFSLKIQDIAFAVGFKDEKYFAKQFKRMTGSSPSDYRVSLKNKNSL